MQIERADHKEVAWIDINYIMTDLQFESLINKTQKYLSDRIVKLISKIVKIRSTSTSCKIIIQVRMWPFHESFWLQVLKELAERDRVLLSKRMAKVIAQYLRIMWDNRDITCIDIWKNREGRFI